MAKKTQPTVSGSDAQSRQLRTKTNPALERLALFVGEWDLEITSMSFQADPSAVERGHSSFDWLEGEAFLIQHSEISNPEFPRSVAIMGSDDAAGTYRMLYFDSRGVSRIYQMTFSGGIWTLWRDFPGFSQRFNGIFSEDGNTIIAYWEKSSDGVKWEHDFDLTYKKKDS